MFGNSNLYNPNYSGFNRGQLYTGNSGMSATPGVLKKTYVEVRPKLNINGKNEIVYKSNEGLYYYKKNNDYILLTDKDAKNISDAGNKAVTIRSDIQTKQTNSTNSFSGGGGSGGGGTGGGRFGGETTTKPTPNNGGGYNLADDPAYKALVNQNKQLTDALNGLKDQFKRPEKLGAEYWAKILGEDYNLENILNRYNQKTNDYYDSLVAHNEDTRNRYIRNNYNFLDDTINSYLNSYKQAAPTATNNRAKAATALANSMYGFDYNTDNDYLALQNKNYLEQERKAELANNPFEAESYYNTMGNYLANIEGQMNTEKVKQYVNSLDAYAQKVAANRAAVSTVYNANAAKYQGLADAASTRATGAANNYLSNNAWQNMYDYYKAITGTDKGASTAVRSNVLSSTGRNTSTTR